jgi:hypothetical protein
MYCQLSLSGNAFERLIQYRVADSFQPLTVPVPFPANTSSWFDGILVTQVVLNQIANDSLMPINELQPDGTVAPNPAGVNFRAAAVSADAAAEIFFVRVQDAASAGLSQPPSLTQSIPIGFIRMIARVFVDAKGTTQFLLSPDLTLIGELRLPPQVVAAIQRATTRVIPIEIADQLQVIFPEGNVKVVNAGITRDANGSIVMRFEFSGSGQTPQDREADWQNFFSPDFVTNLADGDWSVDLDGEAIALALGAAVNPAIKNESPLEFSGNIRSGFIGDSTPRLVLTKNGLVVDACAGFPIHFTVFLNLDLNVPHDNLLRGTLGLDISKNDFDVGLCLGNILLDPSAVVITAADHGQLGAGLGALASDFLFPIKGLAVLAAVSLLLAGYDKALVQGVVADRLRKEPLVTKLPGGGFAFDQVLDSRNDLTKDWLVLKQCTGSGNRLLLSGVLNVPDAVLPRLTAADLEGFSGFVLVDKCEPGKGHAAHGSLVLALEPGHGTDRATAQPVLRPTISVKYGLQPDGTSLMYQVLNDNLGIYQDAATDYTQVYFPGVPCLLEATLTTATLRKEAFEPFIDNPYPLRLRLFTNGGVREYQFGAPPKFRRIVETPGQAAQRISRCKALSASLLLKSYLEKIWLGRPPEAGNVGAQQWEIQLRGLAEGRQLTVWDRDSGVELVKAFADQRGSMNISLVLRGRGPAAAILMGLDDRPFVSAAHLTQIVTSETLPSEFPAVRMAIRQTTLTEIDHLAFDEPIEALDLAEEGTGSLLTVHTVSGKRFAHALAFPYITGQAKHLLLATAHVKQGASTRVGLVAWRGNRRQFLHLSTTLERTDVIGEYSARSSYDLAGERIDLFTQVSDDGRQVVLYQKGIPMQFGTSEWEGAPYGKDS